MRRQTEAQAQAEVRRDRVDGKLPGIAAAADHVTQGERGFPPIGWNRRRRAQAVNEKARELHRQLEVCVKRTEAKTAAQGKPIAAGVTLDPVEGRQIVAGFVGVIDVERGDSAQGLQRRIVYAGWGDRLGCRGRSGCGRRDHTGRVFLGECVCRDDEQHKPNW